MPFDLTVVAASGESGLGDAFFGSEVERESDGFMANFVAQEFQAAPSAGDRRVSLVDQLDGSYEYTVTWMATEGTVVHRAYNLITSALLGEERFDVVDGSREELPGLPPDLDGPPFIVEAGRVFGDQNLRGSLTQFGSRVFPGNVSAHESATFLARALKASGDVATPWDIDEASVSIYRVQDDRPTVRELIVRHVVPHLDTFFSTLQDDYQWAGSDPANAERRGYNFRYSLPMTTDPFPYVRSRYEVDFEFTPVYGEPFHAKFLVWSRQ